MQRKLLTIILCLAILVPASAQSVIQHPWKGKKVAYFGDSITDPRNKAANKKYWALLQEWLGITPYVYGVSGRQWNDIPRQADKCMAEHGDSIDAIIIFMGTNDYNHAVPLGEWFEEKEEMVEAAVGKPKQLEKRMRRTPIMDKDTYRGRINIAMDKVKRMYPTKQIIILTPIHRSGFYPNDKNWQPTEEFTNGCGEYLSAYVTATKEAGDVWAVPVIDWAATSGLFPLMDEHVCYYNNGETDRLHPNNKGHERLARTLMYQLLMYPCTF